MPGPVIVPEPHIADLVVRNGPTKKPAVTELGHISDQDALVGEGDQDAVGADRTRDRSCAQRAADAELSGGGDRVQALVPSEVPAQDAQILVEAIARWGLEATLDIIASGAGYARLGPGIDDVYVPENAVGTALHGDRVLLRAAWDVAERMSWEDTGTAEYVALTRLQADAFVTLDEDVAREAAREVRVATLEELLGAG